MTNQSIPCTQEIASQTRPGRLAVIYRNWKARREVKRLQDRDEHILDDIGVTRDEIAWASRLPLTVNAANALHRTAYTRRKEQQLMWL